MSRLIHRYALGTGHDTQTVRMPKRARVIHVGFSQSPILCALVDEDADTRAFDTGKHERYFVVVADGGAAPEVGVYVGSAQTPGNHKQAICLHVFEVNRP
jgi:hypothetical protein